MLTIVPRDLEFRKRQFRDRDHGRVAGVHAHRPPDGGEGGLQQRSPGLVSAFAAPRRRTPEHQPDRIRAGGARRFDARSDELELLRPARLGIICFRRRFGGGRSESELEDLNRHLVSALERSGEGLVSSTRLQGRYAIRLCVLNHTTAAEDVRGVLEWLEHAEVDAAGVAPPHAHPQDPGADPHQSLVAGGQSARRVETDALRSLAVLEGLTGEQLELLSRASPIVTASTGERVTTRWGGGRDFYIILEGAVRAEVDGEDGAQTWRETHGMREFRATCPAGPSESGVTFAGASTRS